MGTVGVQQIAFPDGSQAIEEERSEAHAGLYWVDTTNEENEVERFFSSELFQYDSRAAQKQSCILEPNWQSRYGLGFVGAPR